MEVIGIDPGQSGALVFLGAEQLEIVKMPIKGKQKDIDFLKVRKFLKAHKGVHVFIEQSSSYGQGSRSAFNYGRGFAALEIALMSCKNPVTFVRSNEWTKEMHKGLDENLKPKAKSAMAVQKLQKSLLKKVPTNRNGKLHDGVVDALLIAVYGQRTLKR